MWPGYSTYAPYKGHHGLSFFSLKNYIWMFNLFVSLGLVCITCQNTLLIIVKTKVGVKSISKVKLNENMPYYDHG